METRYFFHSKEGLNRIYLWMVIILEIITVPIVIFLYVWKLGVDVVLHFISGFIIGPLIIGTFLYLRFQKSSLLNMTSYWMTDEYIKHYFPYDKQLVYYREIEKIVIIKNRNQKIQSVVIYTPNKKMKVWSCNGIDELLQILKEKAPIAKIIEKN